VAFGLVHNDQVVHLSGFSEADQSGRAVTAFTSLMLDSVSTSFTELAVGKETASAKRKAQG